MVTPPAKHCAVCGALFTKTPSDSRKTWGKRKCCTYKCSVEIRRGRSNPKAAYWKGKKRSPEAIAKASESIKRAYAEGRLKHVSANLGLRDEQTSQWKGDDIVYRSAHSRFTRRRGKPRECELCGATGRRIEWALKDDAAVVKVEVGGVNDGKRYSPRPDDYFAACCPCHQAYDDRKRDPLTGRYL